MKEVRQITGVTNSKSTGSATNSSGSRADNEDGLAVGNPSGWCSSKSHRHRAAASPSCRLVGESSGRTRVQARTSSSSTARADRRRNFASGGNPRSTSRPAARFCTCSACSWPYLLFAVLRPALTYLISERAGDRAQRAQTASRSIVWCTEEERGKIG